MVYQFALGLLSAALLAAPVSAQTDPYTGFLEEVAQGDGGACRALSVQHRIENWYGPSVADAFASVEEVMADVTGGPEFAALGCNRAFRHVFLDCSQVDDPTLTHIVPTGVQAATDAERIALMRHCLERAEESGLKP
ncbi:hypothetical protein K3728_16240 [Rhodobacteraceae bacterium M385]|nr:hypothetical protein K3728_16240 [Rhodobacteraceae bacterium M385]